MTATIHGQSTGVFVISITPFTDDGGIDWRSIDTLVDFYIDKGVSGITILGIMGEAPKLSESEAMEFTRYYIARVNGRVPVIVGVSNPGIHNLGTLADVAMQTGAAGVMVAPGGLKTEVQIADYCRTVFTRLGSDVPVCFQDYPQTTGVNISVPAFLALVDAHPQLVMFKHEDWPGLRKLQAIRAACDGTKRRRISILCGNGGLQLPQEMARGADGAMTGFAYPEMLVEVVAAYLAGQSEEGEDIFDAYLPLVRHEQQMGVGLALRKEVLRRRGAIASSAVRAPGPKLDADDLRELDNLIRRQERRLANMGR